MHIMNAVFADAVVDVLDGIGIDVDGVYRSLIADSFRGAHGEPAGTGADICYGLTWMNVENVHHALDLQFLVAIRSFEDGKVAGVWRTGWAVSGFFTRGCGRDRDRFLRSRCSRGNYDKRGQHR